MVPLIEDESAGAAGSPGDQQATVTATTTATDTGSGAASSGGPSVAVSFSDGSTVQLDADDLQLYLLAIQTLLLLYVTYQEATN